MELNVVERQLFEDMVLMTAGARDKTADYGVMISPGGY